MNTPQFDTLRQMMVQEILDHGTYVQGETGKVSLDERVIAVMSETPRHEFVPAELRPYAYLNMPLPIGYGKTISQPFIVALMTDLLELRPHDVVLEIGTGLGYQAAILSQLVKAVYTIEIIEELAAAARNRFARLGYGNVETKIGDGSRGWAEHGPFDRIMVTAAPDLIPPMLLQQLKPGGRMAIPTGLPESQKLLVVAKDEKGRVVTHEVLPVRFSVLETDDGPMA